jgi:hypothetical protein
MVRHLATHTTPFRLTTLRIPPSLITQESAGVDSRESLRVPSRSSNLPSLSSTLEATKNGGPLIGALSSSEADSDSVADQHTTKPALCLYLRRALHLSLLAVFAHLSYLLVIHVFEHEGPPESSGGDALPSFCLTVFALLSWFAPLLERLMWVYNILGSPSVIRILSCFSCTPEFDTSSIVSSKPILFPT